MKNPDLTEIARALHGSEIPPQFDPLESGLLIQLLRLVADGRPVSTVQAEQIASDLGLPPDVTRAFVRQLCESDEEGNVVGILGLSQNNHPHRFEVDGHALTTWCAWDSLFLPGLLKQTARVESTCPRAGTPVRLTITPERVETCEPADAVISLVVPQVTKRGRESVEEVWMTFCCLVHFFSSAGAASEWLSERNQGARILSVEDGYQLGRMAFDDLLKYS